MKFLFRQIKVTPPPPGLLNPRVYPSYTPGGLQTQPYPGIIAVSKMDKYWSENVKIEVVWQKVRGRLTAFWIVNKPCFNDSLLFLDVHT